MKKRFRMLAILSATVLLLGGCGDSLYEMTDDEEQLVVTYAAYSLAKHNIFQKDGMTDAVLAEEETQEEQTKEEQTDTQENSAQNESAAGTASNTTDSTYEEISLAKTIGENKNLKVSYKGYKVQESYQEGTYLSVNPDAGNSLLVMEFTIKNTGDKAVELDTTGLDNTFYASFDGGAKIKETISFGAQSLSFYDGTIKAGKSQKAVLIFQVSEEQAKKISEVTLYVQLNDTTFLVKL